MVWVSLNSAGWDAVSQSSSLHVRRPGDGRKGQGTLTGKLGFYALAHEAVLDVIEGAEYVGWHDGLFVLQQCNFVGPRVIITTVSFQRGPTREVDGWYGRSRVRKVVNEHRGALRHGKNRIGLDLGVWRQNALRKSCDDGFW